MRANWIITAIVLGSLTATAPAQEQQQQMPSPEEMAAMQERMQAAMTPGPEHKWLARFAGEWNVTLKLWWGGPSTPPMSSKGHAETRVVLDGRWVMEELSYELTMPTPTGMQTEKIKSIGLMGYDNFRKQYVTSLHDSMNTHMLVLRGPADPAGKVMRMYGTMDEPALNVIGRTIRSVTTIESDDKYKIEVFDLHAGEDYKVLEFVYERKQEQE